MSQHQITILGMGMSTCTRRALTVAAEVGLDYKIQTVDLMKGAHKQPEFLKEQPFGQIPVLHDGDFRLYESRAICRYLAQKYDSKHTLLPTDAQLFGQVEQWISVESSNYKADAVVGEYMFKPMFGGKPDEEKGKEAIAKVHQTFEIIEKHLAAKNSKFLVGDNFTLADVVYMPYTDYLLKVEQTKDILSKYPHVKAWWENISSRPSWQTVSKLQ
eukprot:TRINITY_DN11826_c0_g1_i1.p1 TRINITY_DN11826_c0_g1~~TRINITY_DN11826_c0_g1_i1.p1  ORF type:complete len:215 (-),score=51.00 TRINITY_DN11826_c0_g1_i1:41-685(-)